MNLNNNYRGLFMKTALRTISEAKYLRMKNKLVVDKLLPFSNLGKSLKTFANTVIIGDIYVYQGFAYFKGIPEGAKPYESGVVCNCCNQKLPLPITYFRAKVKESVQLTPDFSYHNS